MIALFRQVEPEVGNALGYPYPQQVDDQVSAYLARFVRCRRDIEAMASESVEVSLPPG